MSRFTPAELERIAEARRITKELFAQSLIDELDSKLDATSTIPWEQITNKPQLADSHWRSPVATRGDLPLSGNAEEDVRLVLDTNEVFSWDGTEWVLIGANDTSVDWEHLHGKPATFPPSSHDHNDLYYGKGSIDASLAGKAPTVHSHSDLYYDKGEVNAALLLKSDSEHNHDGRYVKPADERLSDARTPLTHKASHKAGGSDAITPGDIGAATSGHNHDAKYAALNHEHDTKYAALSHDHDGRYNTKAEITSALGGKADKGSVLQKDNAVAYTPTAATHPATKGYVDATIDGLGSGDMHKATYDKNNDGIVDRAALADVASEVTWGNVSGKPGSFTPAAHTHTKAEVTDFAHTHTPTDIGAEPAFAKKTAFNKDFGTAAGTVAQGNDARLSNARTPVAHTHTKADVTDFAHLHTPAETGAEPSFTKNTAFNKNFGAAAGTVTEGNDPRLSDDRTPLAHIHTPAEAGAEPAFTKNAAFNKNFGSTVGTVTQGNDARLSDARTPTAHTHTKSQVTDFAHTHTPGEAGAEPAFTKNTAFNKNFGTAVGTVTQGSDPRLSDARTPKAHSHTAAEVTGLPTKVSQFENDAAYVTATELGEAGLGDMSTAVYDTNKNGIVDNAEKVNGKTVLSDVPAGASFTDTTYSAGINIQISESNEISATDTKYTHPTTAGNKHIPTGGSVGQILKNTASGTATWQAESDTVTTVNGKTGAITKADIVALGIPAQDTVVDISGKVDKVSGKQLSTEDYTTVEKNKLSGIEASANNYSHPATHPASVIVENESKRFTTDVQQAAWSAKQEALSGNVTGHYHAADRAWANITGKPSTYAPDTHTHTPAEVGAEPVFSKNAAFNKNFGSTAGTVAEGNHTHAFYHQGPTAPTNKGLIWIDTSE